MNTYEVEFFSMCPNNGIRIKYQLKIQTEKTIMVEDIVDATYLFDRCFHEEAADQLYREFGGIQTLVADHHGVRITTHRG
jgi:class 3 adenylate cyclase